MQYAETGAKLAQYRQQIAELRNRMSELQQSVEPEKVADYEFSTAGGKVRLSELFGEKQYVFVVHNTSPDELAAQQKFKIGRGWRFRMMSDRGTSFAEDVGYHSKEAGSPGSRYSSNKVDESAACPTTASGRKTISARSGISLTCCPKVPMAGNRNTNTIDL